MIRYNLSGTWRTVKNVYARVSGTWRTVGQVSVKTGGVWRNVWSYSWKAGQWSDCSVSCGGGTQTRSVTCLRNDGQTVADSLCTKYVGGKPSTSQPCNTQGCVTCSYSENVTEYGHTCMLGGTFKTKIRWNGSFITPEEGVSGHVPSYTSGGYIYTPGTYKRNQYCGSNKYSNFYEACRQAV